MRHLYRHWFVAGFMILSLGACSDDEAVPNSPDGSDEVEVQPDAAVVSDLSGDMSTGADAGDEFDLGEDLSDGDLGVDASSDSDFDVELPDGGTGELSCTEVLQCILGCPDGDTTCSDTCQGQGTLEAQGQISAYLDCVDENCPEDLGLTELVECVEDHCSTEQSACLAN